MTQKSLYINGQWTSGHGREFSSVNPSTGKVIWEGTSADKKDIDAAIDAAREAFFHWSVLPLEKRIAFLEKFRAALEKQKQDFAKTISEENGKPYWESLTEAAAMINKIAISTRAHQERAGDKQADAGARWIRFRPHGVVAVFGPFNLPGHLPNGHIIPALLAGNTVVFKPSEQTPLVGRQFIKMWEEAGLPKGVLNLLQGEKQTGMDLSAHKGLDGLFFTGSCAVGKMIHKSFGGHPEKILALEMGGNNPLIVSEVKDLKAAAYLTIQSAFITAGQRCTCARRLIVLKDKKDDEFIAALIKMTKQIEVGSFEDRPEPFMGPVISDGAAQNLLAWQEKLTEKGGKALVKMEPLKASPLMLTPGIMDTTAVANRPDEEIFGPFLQIIRVKNFDVAIKEANRTAFGLAAGILTDNSKLYAEFLQKSRAGIINWNRPTTGASSESPFGGIGQSGNHRPSAFFAADYCSYPVASIEENQLTMPKQIIPGIGMT